VHASTTGHLSLQGRDHAVAHGGQAVRVKNNLPGEETQEVERPSSLVKKCALGLTGAPVLCTNCPFDRSQPSPAGRIAHRRAPVPLLAASASCTKLFSPHGTRCTCPQFTLRSALHVRTRHPAAHTLPHSAGDYSTLSFHTRRYRDPRQRFFILFHTHRLTKSRLRRPADRARWPPALTVPAGELRRLAPASCSTGWALAVVLRCQSSCALGFHAENAAALAKTNSSLTPSTRNIENASIFNAAQPRHLKK
jgi:hypothetical protein